MMIAWKSQDLKAFSMIRDRLFPLHEALLLETNPSPLKYAVSLFGKCRNEVRLPLVPISQATEIRVKKAMIDVGLPLGKDNDDVIQF
jgi:4-hydroxy-tetrahydrodipicolinate synthase